MFALKNTKNNVGGKVKEHAKEYIQKCKDVLKSKNAATMFNNGVQSVDVNNNAQNKSRELSLQEERIKQEAISFCVEHDSEKSLIPLCQVAYITNPTYPHVRSMYREYCISSESTQKKILELKEVSQIEGIQGGNWWHYYLGKFIADYSKYELGEQRYEYVFGQYFYRLLNYGDARIDLYTESVFPVRVQSKLPFEKKNNILDLIDEYLYYRESDEYKGKLEAPMTYLWRELGLDSCEEKELAAVLGLFIIGVCYAAPEMSKKARNGFDVSINDVETAEDLFYLTLLALYEHYD